MPITPVWGKLKAAAPTLPYDLTIVHDHQQGVPLTGVVHLTYIPAS